MPPLTTCENVDHGIDCSLQFSEGQSALALGADIQSKSSCGFPREWGV